MLLSLAPNSYPRALKPEHWAVSAHLHTLSPPQSLPRCHMVSRERLTIIPHGVPFMTKLLRYFVSEDSIFLHLEHVQGEGPSVPPSFGVSLFSPTLSSEEDYGLHHTWGTDREPRVSEG